MNDNAGRVRAVRQRLGLIQERFAAEIGVSFSTVSRWENAHNEPSSLSWRASPWMARHESELGSLCAFSHRLTVEKLTPISAANLSWIRPRRCRTARTLPALSFIVTPPPTWERAAATPSTPLLAP